LPCGGATRENRSLKIEEIIFSVVQIQGYLRHNLFVLEKEIG